MTKLKVYETGVGLERCEVYLKTDVDAEIERLERELSEARKGEALSDRIAVHWQTEAHRLQAEKGAVEPKAPQGCAIHGECPTCKAERWLGDPRKSVTL